jgi:hypothetical protein
VVLCSGMFSRVCVFGERQGGKWFGIVKGAVVFVCVGERQSGKWFGVVESAVVFVCVW